MTLLSRWLGPSYTSSFGDRNGQIFLASRSISVSDLLEVEAQLTKAFPRVEIGRVRSDEPPTPLVEPLDKASDPVLRGVVVQAWAAGEWPAFKLRVGQDVQADVMFSLIQDRAEGLPDETLGQMTIAANRCVEIVTQAGHRILSQRHWRDLASATVVLTYVALLALFAVSVWPNVLWILVAALGLIPTAVLASQRLGRVATRLGDHRGDRVVIRHLTRDEWRRRRYETRRDWKARGVGVVVGVVATLATSFVVKVLS